MEIKCSFEIITYLDEDVFGCLIRNQQIPENQELKLIGQHEDGKTNINVHFVQFQFCTVTKIPPGLTRIFPNLKILDIDSSKLQKISKNDLIEYKNLAYLNFDNNEVEFLPGDLFEDFPNLVMISFEKNKLKVIEPTILDELEKLKFADFRGNLNYGKFYSIDPKWEPNASLEEIKCELFENYPKKYEFVKDLKDSKLMLKAELEKEKIKNCELTDKFQNGFVGDIKTFTEDKTTKDFSIQMEGQEFRVHKFLLAARSPTLTEILKNNPEVENLNLVDISVEIFEIILKFVYTDELPGDDGTNFIHLFAAAGKFKIQKMVNYAADKILEMPVLVNPLDVLLMSNKYGKKDLKQKAFREVKKKYPKMELKDELANDLDKITEFIKIMKIKEEADKKMKELLNK